MVTASASKVSLRYFSLVIAVDCKVSLQALAATIAVCPKVSVSETLAPIIPFWKQGRSSRVKGHRQ